MMGKKTGKKIKEIKDKRLERALEKVRKDNFDSCWEDALSGWKVYSITLTVSLLVSKIITFLTGIDLLQYPVLYFLPLFLSWLGCKRLTK